MNTTSMHVVTAVSAALLASATTPVALAFMEEGEDLVLYRNGARDFNPFTRCKTAGDLAQAQTTGCNPWRDTDANFSYRKASDQEKSSVHFHMTRALAAAAGMDPCAAHALAIFTQAADVADPLLDQLFWAPTPADLLPLTTDCAELLEAVGLRSDDGLDGDGYWVSPDFTYRSAAESDEAERRRESYTFHFAYMSDGSFSCTEDGDPDPISHQNVLPLQELYRWATTEQVDGFPENPLNQCSYTAPGGNPGPITEYGGDDAIKPNSLGSFGIYLHPFQDAFSHRPITDQSVFYHTYGSDTREPSGFVSNHLAGEFGTTDAGVLGTGETIQVSTSAGTWPAVLHSQDTADAIEATFQQVQEWMSIHPGFQSSAPLCTDTEIAAVAFDFSRIPNRVPSRTVTSGAKARADLADALYHNLTASQRCAW